MKLARNLTPDIHWGKQGIAQLNTKTQITVAKPAQAKQLNAYIHEIFATSNHLITHASEYRMGPWRRRRWIARKLVNSEEICLLAVNNGDIVGMIDCWTDRRKRVTHSTCFAMSVKSGWRCKGVGSLLLRHFIEWVKAHPVLERIELHVHSDNSHAITLYKNFDFQVEGTRKRVVKYEDGRVVDDHIMALWP
ncbi:GNAT family N-acetyltransferase [Kordiimonas pumila]|uniref:GNAT family N-acetyltransferase n=1 Tax=Kordiimonas pumila TaxID=2161677 RepID=A0ABV7D138_9PROT|nr:GNAT family N-acetyltransferase [Kordiimonas pumila]